MADEATEEGVEETTPPTEDASTEATPQEEATPQDYETRYNDLRPQYDQVQNEVSTLKEQNQQLTQLFQMAQQGDPEALDALGLQMEEEAGAEDADEYEDPDERIARIEQQLAERDELTQAEQEEQEVLQELDQGLNELESNEQVELSDDEVDFIAERVFGSPALPDGKPDIEGAYKTLRKVQSDYQKQYVESKRAPKVPAGTAGTEKLDLSSTEKRHEAMAQIMAEEGSD